MRYYKIEVTDPKSGAVQRTFTSLLTSGAFNPGALQVEFDINQAPFHVPFGDSYVRIWGISIKDISQASDFNGKGIRVSAGMSKGLPLANPAQAGLLVEGVIRQAYGHWQDTTQTLDLIINAGGGSSTDPKNIVIDWPAGTSLSDAVRSVLSRGFPGYKLAINISRDLILAHDEKGFYATLIQFADFVKRITAGTGGDGYAGVEMIVLEKTITVYDGPTKKTPRPIAFTDLIGQPTWIDPGTMQFSCPVRADIQVNDIVQMPKTQTTVQAQSLSQYRDGSVFQGVFAIKSIRHVGNFRQPDAAAWVTTFDAYPAAA